MTSLRTRAAAACAALAAALVLVGLIPAPAQAAPPYEVDAWIGSDVYAPWTEDLQRQEVVMELRVGYPGEEVSDVDLHVTLEILDDLGALALETDAPGCTADGTELECDFTDVSSEMDISVPVDLIVPPSVVPYSHTETKIAMYADHWDPVTFYSYWQFVPPAGYEADYAVEVESFQGIEPGGSVQPAVAFENRGAAAFQDLFFLMESGYGLETHAEYSNCGEYGTGAICLLDDIAVEPGAVYELSPDTPVTGVLDTDLPGPKEYVSRFSVLVPGQHFIDVEDIDFFDAEEELRFEPSERGGVPRTPGLVIEMAEHPYDLTMDAGPLAGATGDEVGLELTVSSLGPADAVAYKPGYGFAMAVQLPTGVTWAETDEDGTLWSFEEGNYVICVDAAKRPDIAAFDPALYRVERIDGFCWLRINTNRTSLLVGETATVVLPAVVTGTADADDGLAAVVERHSDEPVPDLDGDPDSNIATISLDVEETPGGTPSEDPSASGDPTGRPTGDASGKLPKTGASQTAVLAGAAALVIAGAVLTAAARRRRTAE
ncbi:LPXTG cell wall anchor domain-containing protein [Glycomyces sp. NPDC047369]